MSASYDEKVVLVTGARRGLGAVVAEHFERRGAHVVGFSRHVDEVPKSDRRYDVAVDIGDASSVSAGFEEIRKRFGKLDICVNNAAVLTSQYAMILPAASAQAMVETNLLGTFLVSREAAKLMRKGKWGRIVSVSSMAVSLEPMGDSVYAATKAAVTTLANIMAKELATTNITCNTLGISAFETDMLSQLPRDKVNAVIAALPLARMATREDVAHVLDFFCGPGSGCITAQTVYLGGVH
ncbi:MULTISPECIES: SDR family NAD(P)-dependent oxidoreductase [Mycobacterium]|uniref:Oxidoreductase n=1 Tax=Mycobacterium intracellulare TaxID=1767 RepID=B2NIB2_MYCIT|nr:MULTISPECIES: SDR family oxidoreductase [Mycobacterium]ASW96088.1 NAD(P)-dependent oxidoreductase [Mycobacterium intracellulare]MCA2232269.1 SDR family oxidoreductase [Mycobacterium intracellulare]PBA22950.1 NAD(P)-dependent oxidoreductase [Mycobacterium intracellulare]UGU08880.1 SDR family oxidoreductase [Mycobacterium intracellulare subsp. intracellulare]WSE53402.1 SDR family oxidoreductase [Mycobacterium sp. 2-64]